MPPADDIKGKAYYKFHHSFSHHTNSCNYFRRQLQAAIDDGHLIFHEMGVDTTPCPAAINTMGMQQAPPKVLVRPSRAESTKGKHIMIGEQRANLRDKSFTREVVCETTPKGKMSQKITAHTSGHGGHATSKDGSKAAQASAAIRLLPIDVLTATSQGASRFLKLKHPDIDLEAQYEYLQRYNCR